jgi:TetR/AcrR family hemagglutinin/protease transcriptional regulator
MTKRAARTRLPPEERRESLLGHAVACFADHGLARATQAQVAARAGVSVSAVYSYFRTRADLVTAVLDHVEATIEAMVEAALAPPRTASAALKGLAVETAGMALHQPDIVRVWLDWSTGVRADVWPRFLRLQSRLQGRVEAVLARGTTDADAGEDGGLASAKAQGAVRSAARLFVGGAHTLALMRFESVGADEMDVFIGQMVGGALAAAGAGRDGQTPPGS